MKQSAGNNKSALALTWKLNALLCAMLAAGGAQAAPHEVGGNPGDPASWRSDEFKADWGLGAIHADEAYAAGYTGKGQKVGIFDTPVNKHPEFAGDGKLTNVVTEGYRAYTDPHREGVKAGDYFYFDGAFHFYSGSQGLLSNHGVHVAGITAANRDGTGMHGVAFDSQIISVDNDNDGPAYGEFLGLDGSVTNAGWQAMINNGVRVINNSWGVSIPDFLSDNGGKPEALHFELKDAQEQFDQVKPLLGSLAGAGYQGAIDAARNNILVLFAAGNDGNYNQPDVISGLAYFVPDIAPNWLSVASIQDPTKTGDYSISTFSSRCGYTASFCVAAPGSKIYSTVANGSDPNQLVSDYGIKSGTSMATPHVTGAVAVLLQRFPYMTSAQIADVLKTTATDMGAPGIDALYGWGMINLGKAINGPGMFYTVEDIPQEFRIPDPAGVAYGSTQFVANIPGLGAEVDQGTLHARICDDFHCGWEVYSNNISGHGGLTKEGEGALVLTGANTYAGPTRVNEGLLAINGSVTSAVTVQNAGILGGSGSVGSLTARRGGTVAPGNSIGTLNVANNVSFELGSRYAVEVAPNGQSDRIHSGGSATIGGGEVAVSLENSPNLLSQSEVRSLLGQQYNILTADQGVSGQFDAVAPNYLFLGTGLSYQPNQVTLKVGRNDTAFASVAQTHNERAVAAAADALAAGNPVYESILNAGSAGEARQAFRQLSGQIHADIASAQVNDSRYLREALNGRLRQAEGLATAPDIKSDEGGAWAQLLGAWDHASGDANATGYQASTYGVLLGLDSALADDGRLGVATGYTRTSLDGGYGSNADSDNYHLAVYGGKQFGELALRAGGTYTWHRIDTSRSVNYGAQSDRETAKYSARTEQVFAEAGYSVKAGWVNLEPFANLAYINFQNNGISEDGGAAALHGDKQHTDATVSTLGLRADTEWQASKTTAVALRSELGWQHQYGELERGTGLRFNGGSSPFVVNSVSASRDGAVLKASAEVAVNKNATLSLGYGGLLSQNHQDNSVNAGFTWRF
ncbi:autotransporter outer membrane beta-barrel domain-containing protein [Serratia plymuthica]|uniref:Autotransporter outer membrane beta-barrel domain-containing protein n=4 Tax=Serratia plymuthica TaxID=82996 RepID=A0A2X4YD86_SERPL|nr:autotransporter serine protease [Serratia plymuthica]QPS18625.1 autotransporter outer membrane beta-barrel domain-containing protein [Serratia plymuthica]QPS64898.1 autotransporter outer membrane beta-barrel domain-containing protein [Serratia plymuthica]RKS62648.1 subtilase-type serine protease [Serratia plymuthica]CAI2499661.1 Extracellular serine protease precursor [Serratia plymuthica]SQI46424.1 Extracellular serine protease precursor [Serratia plymuthica]